MSFPLAAQWLEEQGVDPENATDEQYSQALMLAAVHNTPLGFIAMKGLILATKERVSDAASCVRGLLAQAGHEDACESVMRHCWINDAVLEIDFDPNSKLGGEYARLNTDVLRPLISEEFGIHLAMLNCCGGVASEDPQKLKAAITPKRQLLSQISIDC